MIRRRCAKPANATALSAIEAATVASSASTSIFSFGGTDPSRSPFSHAPPPLVAVHSSPVPKSWTKPKTTSFIVEPSATAIETEKNGMLRFAFSEPSIGSTTTCVVGDTPERALAELLRDEVEVEPLVGVQPLEPRDDRGLGRGVDRGRLVAALAGADDGLALVPARHAVEHPLQVADRGAAELEPGLHGSRGWKSSPETSFG